MPSKREPSRPGLTRTPHSLHTITFFVILRSKIPSVSGPVRPLDETILILTCNYIYTKFDFITLYSKCLTSTFQSAHLKKSQVPGYFDADAALADDKSYCVNQPNNENVHYLTRPKTSNPRLSRSPSVAVYPSASVSSPLSP